MLPQNHIFQFSPDIKREDISSIVVVRYGFIGRNKHTSYYRILALVFFILIFGLSSKLTAQQYNHDDYLVLYAHGTNGLKPEVKYLLVSTYNIKLSKATLQHGTESFELGVTSQFRKFIENINSAEGFSPVDYKVCYLKDESKDVNKIVLKIFPDATYPSQFYEHIKKGEENSRSAAVQVRSNIIRYYKEKGYVIRQVEFEPDINLSDYIYMKDMKIENVDALTSWEVTHYDKGEMSSACNTAVKWYEDEKNFKAAAAKAEVEIALKKSKAKQEIKQELEWLNAMDKNPLTNSNRLYKYEDAAKALIKKCDSYLSMYGSDAEIEQIRKTAQFYAQSAAEAMVNAVAEVAGLVTSTPWSYGYGQFLGTESQTYIHRFNFGLAGSYTEGRIVSVDLSVMTNFMMLPSRTLNYRLFESNNGVTYDVSKTRQVQNLQIISGSVGPALTIWPQKNIYLQVIPEAHLGMIFNSNESNAPINEFTAFPALNGKFGFRFGKFYLSGMYGTLWKAFKINEGSGYATEEGTISTPYGTVQGKYYATSFDDNKWIRSSYWIVSIGFNFDNR